MIVKWVCFANLAFSKLTLPRPGMVQIGCLQVNSGTGLWLESLNKLLSHWPGEVNCR